MRNSCWSDTHAVTLCEPLIGRTLYILLRDGRIKREVENVVQRKQDEERKSYALNLRIRHSSVSTSEDQPSPSVPETVEDEETGLEMKTITARDD